MTTDIGAGLGLRVTTVAAAAAASTAAAPAGIPVAPPLKQEEGTVTGGTQVRIVQDISVEYERGEYWEKKSALQIGIILGLALLLVMSVAAFFLTLNSTGREKTWANMKALVIDPQGGLAATSGALFYAIVAVVGIALWALLDNKENRFAEWIKGLFVNKERQEKIILSVAALITLTAIPFILLTAQGCEPFAQGFEKFKEMIGGHTQDLLAASGSAFTCYAFLGLATLVGYSLDKSKSAPRSEEEGKSLWDAFWESKSPAQQKCLYALLAVLLIAPFFIITTALGAQPFSQGLDNFKHSITDHTTSVGQGVTAAAILMGLGGATVLSLWSLFGSAEGTKNFFSKWDGEKNVWKKRVAIVMTALFLCAIPLIIMTAKGTEPFADGFSSMIKLMEAHLDYSPIVLFLGMAATTAVTFWAFSPERETGLERYQRSPELQEAIIDPRKASLRAEYFVDHYPVQGKSSFWDLFGKRRTARKVMPAAKPATHHTTDRAQTERLTKDMAALGISVARVDEEEVAAIPPHFSAPVQAPAPSRRGGGILDAQLDDPLAV